MKEQLELKEQLEQIKKAKIEQINKESAQEKSELKKKLKEDAQKQREKNQQLDSAQRIAEMMDELKAGNTTKNRGGHEVTLQQLVLDNAEQTLKEDVHSYVDNRSAMMGLIKSFADLNASLDQEFKVRFAPGFYNAIELFRMKVGTPLVDMIDPPAEEVLPELVYAVTVDKDKAIHCADLLDANGVALELGPVGRVALELGPVEQKGADLLNGLFRKYVGVFLEEKGYAVDANDPTLFKPTAPENAITQEVLSRELKEFLAKPDVKNELSYSERPSPRPR